MKNGFGSKTMLVTPDMAAQWLEGNVRNRKIDQRHVDSLAAEMKAGRWKENHHQAIAFDVNGTFIDGQHRLWAIIQADVPVPMTVFFNVPTENIDTIDGGKSRTIVDRMNLSGEFGASGVDSRDTSTLRDLIRGLKPARKISYSRQVELLNLHRDVVRFAVEHVGSRVQGVGVSYVRAVIARAWYSTDHIRLADFCRVLTDGVVDGPADRIIMRLRDHLMAHRRVSGARLQQELYGKVERVLQVWLRGETRSNLLPSRQELFPLPEEVEA